MKIKKFLRSYPVKNLIIIAILTLISIFAVLFGFKGFGLNDVDMSFVAAILGGVVSGGLTLTGVKATLDNQRREEFINKYPFIKNNTEDILYELKESVLILDNCKTFSQEKVKKQNLIRYLKKMEMKRDKIFDKSNNCTGRIFLAIIDIRKELNSVFSYISSENIIIAEVDDFTGDDITSFRIDETEFYSKIEEVKKKIYKLEEELKLLDKRFYSYIKTSQ